MKVWITKYALVPGTGVFTREVDSDMYVDICFRPQDWHRTRVAAIARVEDMRAAEVARLEQQLAQVRALTIEVPE